MNKKTNKKATKATLNDFLARKLQRDEERDKTFDIKISSMDRTISVKKVSDSDMLDFIDELGDSKSPKRAFVETLKLIYRHCLDLQNQELQESLEIKNPYDIVLTDILFDFKDKNEIMEQFNEAMGFKPESIDEEIKN